MKFLSEKLGVAPEKQRLILVAYFVFFVTGMTSTLIGTIIPNLREAYGLNYLVSGSLFTFHQTGNLCAVILAGFLPYIIGRKKSVTILYSGLAIGTILITASGLPFLLMAAYTLTGVGRGTTSNITNVIVSESSENKGAGLNLLHAIFAFGALVSPFILLICSRLFGSQGWRITLWILALCMIVSFFLFATSSLSNKREVRTSAVKVESAEGEVVTGLPFYKSFDYWLNVSILLFYLCGESGNMGWLVTYFKDTGLMGQTFAQMTSSIMWIMIMAGRILAAAISGKVNKSLMILILALLNTGFFILMISTQSMPLIIAGLLGTGFSMSGIYPTTLSTMKREYNSSPLSTGLAIGIALVGGITMPVTVGAIAEKVTSSALAQGLSTAAAEKAGVSSGISAIAVALSIMLILTVIKFIRERKA
ncbi:MAG: MFS transporter [Treponema sp.]|nr:MFS transporter [Treponema sp.]